MATKRPRITDEQSAQIAEYREAGRSLAWIARKLDLSIGAVSWHCLRYGIESPEAKPVPIYSGPMIMERGAGMVRRFTAEEDAILLNLSMQNVTVSAMAKQLGRKHNSIIGRLATLARRDERAAAE